MKKRDVFALALISIGLVGCETVEPWERGNLAKPQMAVDPEPLHTAMNTHTYTSREAASGGDTAEGGGCGCE